MNGITEIKPFLTGKVKKSDIIAALLSDLGCSVSDMPRDYPSKDYCGRWELFEPEKVEEPEDLPDYWRMVYNLHNQPTMKDCQDFHYRYVHVPVEIMCRYPRIPTKGIFCICEDNVDIKKMTGDDLININNEFAD